VSVKQIVTGQITWDVAVGEDGYFYATAVGVTLPQCSSETYAKLEETCKRHAAKYKVKVAVPYMRFARRHGGSFFVVHGIASGIHGGNGKILVREGEALADGNIVFGTADPITPYSHDVYPPLDEGDAKRVIEVNNQLLALQQERNAILARYKWLRGFGGTVSDAIDQATRDEAAKRDG
jgi:hypothetical protein